MPKKLSHTSKKSSVTKRKKVKSVELKLTLSAKQKKLFVKCCKLNQTTTTKVLKRSINAYLNFYADQLKVDHSIARNQLKLFDFTPKPGKQLEIDID